VIRCGPCVRRGIIGGAPDRPLSAAQAALSDPPPPLTDIQIYDVAVPRLAHFQVSLPEYFTEPGKPHWEAHYFQRIISSSENVILRTSLAWRRCGGAPDRANYPRAETSTPRRVRADHLADMTILLKGTLARLGRQIFANRWLISAASCT
jgi:hypothetical protein